MNRIAVVGGGLSGLEFALHAARNGIATTVFEAGSARRQHHVHFDLDQYEGDSKTKCWTHDEFWAADAGLPRRLGGRSLCYHGVMLPLEPAALADWPEVWRQRLQGDQGLYQQILQQLQADYPELTPGGIQAPDLQHVPQAAKLHPSGQFYAYSPLLHIAPFLASGMIEIAQRQISRVESTADGLMLYDDEQQKVQSRGVQQCVLAASAIVNSALISRSLHSNTKTQLTDHFCFGLMICLADGFPIGPLRHQMLWHGYAKHHEVGANIFVQERGLNPAGLRVITLMAVVEQHPHHAGFSVLHHQVKGHQVSSHIEASVSEYDKQQQQLVTRRLLSFARQLFGKELTELADDHPAQPCMNRNEQDEQHSWPSFDEALFRLSHCDQPERFCRFSFPYGGFEHESCSHPIAGTQLTSVSTALELQAIPGVFAIGPGAFPRLGIANPALTICAVSRWLAENIQEFHHGR